MCSAMDFGSRRNCEIFNTLLCKKLSFFLGDMRLSKNQTVVLHYTFYHLTWLMSVIKVGLEDES